MTNLRIIDPSQKMDEIGNIVIDEKENKIHWKKSDTSESAEKIDLKGLVAIPGLVDMKALLESLALNIKKILEL